MRIGVTHRIFVGRKGNRIGFKILSLNKWNSCRMKFIPEKIMNWNRNTAIRKIKESFESIRQNLLMWWFYAESKTITSTMIPSHIWNYWILSSSSKFGKVFWEKRENLLVCCFCAHRKNNTPINNSSLNSNYWVLSHGAFFQRWYNTRS